MGPGNHDEFDVLTRLGGDLPGAVLIVPETDTPPSAGSLDLTHIAGFKTVAPEGVVKFSLAGVQLKFTANPDSDKLTVPGRGETGRCIIKVGSERYRDLPEAEFGAMQLAKLIGIHIGYSWTEEMISVAWKHKNVWIGSDAHAPRYWDPSFVRFINSRGQDKVLFGTDWPVIDFERSIMEIDALDLKETARKKLLWENAIRVYNLESWV